MLEKPDLPDESIAVCLQHEYGLQANQVAFLPLGADRNTAVYRVGAGDGTSYFVKLRSGVFDETSASLPKCLRDQGIEQIISPLVTQTGQLWADLEAFKVIVYPFIEGRNGREAKLSDQQWGTFGAALKRIHTAHVPSEITARIRQETYSPLWRETARTFLAGVEDDMPRDPVAARLTAFLRTKQQEVHDLVEHAERLAHTLQARSSAFTLCHSDIHASNILIDARGALYVVDWDDPIMAPKERDLMFVGGGQGFVGHSAQEEEALFYRGYGQTQIDPATIAYYRYERIVEDIAVFCQELLLTNDGGQDREQSLRYLVSSFLPNGPIEIAYKSDRT